MFNYLIKIEYEGTNFVGWQSQKNGKSIQDNIEKALKKVFGAKIKIIKGANNRQIIVKTNKVEIKIPAKLSMKSLICSGSFVFSISDRIGTKAWLNAPSAKNLLNRLGILSTTTKMS